MDVGLEKVQVSSPASVSGEPGGSSLLLAPLVVFAHSEHTSSFVREKADQLCAKPSTKFILQNLSVVRQISDQIVSEAKGKPKISTGKKIKLMRC